MNAIGLTQCRVACLLLTALAAGSGCRDRSDFAGMTAAKLAPVDATLTSTSGEYRWLNVADQPYSDRFRSTFTYAKAEVTLHYAPEADVFHGVLTARGLKPHFLYQMKLIAQPLTEASAKLGASGRWWCEQWDGAQWTGQNLNDKGSGSRPSPNDRVYLALRRLQMSTVPGGRLCRFTGYTAFGCFFTDGSGNARVPFQADSSYHVFFKTSQRVPEPRDGPVIKTAFNVRPFFTRAYDANHAPAEVEVFGEWERLPVGGTFLPPGRYECQFLVTEESFHGSGGAMAGNWAAVLIGDVDFTVTGNKASL